MGFNRRYSQSPAHWMKWQQTIGDHIEYDIEIRVSCRSCNQWKQISPQSLLGRLALTDTLINRIDICDACGGETIYLASTGAGTPYRPLLT